jgi:putative YhdH/YhfP family quinone oxidoreductase
MKANIEFKSFVVEEIEGAFVSKIKMLNVSDLPEGEVLIQVHFSSINYKDALSVTGNKGVTKSFPHTPGIDASGIVVTSSDTRFKEGDEVIVTGYDLGMNTSGGFGQYIQVPAEWVVKLPLGLTLKESMIIGTAGFTAGISVSRLVERVQPNDGPILVSGATGGVGSVALALLKKLGYTTIAVSGKENEFDFLRKLGASKIIARSEFQEIEKRPILSAQYAGAIDTVGGTILENILKSLNPLGVVTTCGSVSSTQLNMTVFPFILRGISLIGISAQNYPTHLRAPLWSKFATDWKITSLLDIYNEIGMEDIHTAIESILKGQLKGRTIINLHK